MHFLPWPIFLLLNNLDVPIGMVHVGAVWVLSVVTHVGRWGHTLEWKGQQFLADCIANQL